MNSTCIFALHHFISDKDIKDHPRGAMTPFSGARRSRL